jgi:putative aldouronate transport system substrate-binding protein
MKSMEPYFANILKKEMDSGINSVIDPFFLVEKTVTENVVMERDYETIVSPAVIDKFNHDNVKLVNMFATPEYKAFIDWMRQMYVKGYIRKDVLSAEIVNMIGDDRLNMYGMMTTNTGTPDDFTLELNNSIFKTHEVISGRIAPLYLPYTAGTATMNFINAKSEHPDRAMQLIELINTDPEMYNLLAYGIEGDHWVKNENAGYTDSPINILRGDAYSVFDWVLGSVANSYGRSPNFIDARLSKWNVEAPLSPLFGFVPDLSELTQDKAKIDAVVNEFVKALNSGADSDYEKHYKEFLAKLDAAGVDKFLAALQIQVDAYLGK